MDDPWKGRGKDDFEDPYASVFTKAYRAVFKRTRRRRLVFWGVLAATGLGLFGWKAPPWFIARADKSEGLCSNANYEKEPGASLACQGRARRWLWPAKLVPWTRAAALQHELTIRADEAETRVTLATEVFLDPAMRDEAIDTLLHTVADARWPAGRRREEWVFSLTASTGSREKTLELAPYATGNFDHARLVRAALGLGDLEAAMRFARVEDADSYGYEYDMKRGAVLCLGGDIATGLGALGMAMRRYQAAVNYPYPEAQVAALLCGKPLGSEHNGLYGEQLWMAEIVGGVEPMSALLHIAPNVEYDDKARDRQEAFFAAALVGGVIEEPADVVAYAGTMTYDVGSSMSSWVSFGPVKSGYSFDPSTFEKAADQLDALADRFDKGEVKVEPQAQKKAYDFDADRWRFKRDVVDKLLVEPSKHLREAAYVLRVEAVAIYATMLDGASTKRVVARLPKVPGATALLVGNALAHVGEKALARPFYETATTGADAGARMYAWLSLAMIELGDGHGREAVVDATKASDAMGPFKVELEKTGMAWALDVTHSVGWVAAAASLMAGDSTVPVALPTPDYFEDDLGDPKSIPRSWFDLARADEKTRRIARFRMFDPTIVLADQAVFPAMIYVLREVARDGKSPDVWVDKLLPIHDATLNGVLGLRARAEAARWRGALDEAKTWGDRAARLEKLLTTPRSASLALLAGVD